MPGLNDDDVYIVAAKRSPIGRMGGVLSGLAAHEIGSQVILDVMTSLVGQHSNLKDYIVEHLEEVIIGQVLTASTGQNPARQSSVMADLPYSIPAWSLNMVCGSGLKSVCLGFDRLKLSRSSRGGWILAGGQESMSQAPHATPPRACLRRGNGQNSAELPHFGNFSLLDTIMNDALTDSFHKIPMYETAEIIAQRFGISREDQDKFAYKSQEKCSLAMEFGLFKDEITPIKLRTSPKEEAKMFLVDEHPRPQTTLENLAKLKVISSPKDNKLCGTVTAGNSSGVNDGAAFVVLCRGDQVHRLDSLAASPKIRIVGWHQTGLAPELMGIGPVSAIRGLLETIGWTIDKVDYFEINEAFASQSIAIANELTIPFDRLNVRGGAIALGHPVGSSGARILVTLVHILRQAYRQRATHQRGVASLCIGGGMGIAMAIETC